MWSAAPLTFDFAKRSEMHAFRSAGKHRRADARAVFGPTAAGTLQRGPTTDQSYCLKDFI